MYYIDLLTDAILYILILLKYFSLYSTYDCNISYDNVLFVNSFSNEQVDRHRLYHYLYRTLFMVICMLFIVFK